ncbi:MAG: hypothetical protein AB1405_14030 [Bdellovibrionota bacterium]
MKSAVFFLLFCLFFLGTACAGRRAMPTVQQQIEKRTRPRLEIGADGMWYLNGFDTGYEELAPVNCGFREPIFYPASTPLGWKRGQECGTLLFQYLLVIAKLPVGIVAASNPRAKKAFMWPLDSKIPSRKCTYWRESASGEIVECCPSTEQAPVLTSDCGEEGSKSCGVTTLCGCENYRHYADATYQKGKSSSCGPMKAKCEALNLADRENCSQANSLADKFWSESATRLLINQ